MADTVSPQEPVTRATRALLQINNIRRKWRLGAHRQLYTWRATEPLQDGTTPRGQQYPQPSHEPPPQCREKTKQNKTTLTWAPVTLKEIQWKPIK
mgnify:CR=1 FL=1